MIYLKIRIQYSLTDKLWKLGVMKSMFMLEPFNNYCFHNTLTSSELI